MKAALVRLWFLTLVLALAPPAHAGDPTGGCSAQAVCVRGRASCEVTLDAYAENEDLTCGAGDRFRFCQRSFEDYNGPQFKATYVCCDAQGAARVFRTEAQALAVCVSEGARR